MENTKKVKLMKGEATENIDRLILDLKFKIEKIRVKK